MSQRPGRPLMWVAFAVSVLLPIIPTSSRAQVPVLVHAPRSAALIHSTLLREAAVVQRLLATQPVAPVDLSDPTWATTNSRVLELIAGMQTTPPVSGEASLRRAERCAEGTGPPGSLRSCALPALDLDVAAAAAHVFPGLPSALARALEQTPATVEELEDVLAETAREIVRRCGSSASCLDAAASEATRPSILRRLTEKTCLGRNPNALKSLGFHYALFLTGMAAAGFASSQEEFPFDVLVGGALVEGLWEEIACRTELEGRGESHAGLSRGRELLAHWLTYLAWLPANVAIMTTASLVEDVIRGHEVDWAQYLHQGAFIVLRESLWHAPGHVLVLNPLYLRAFPRMRARITRLFADGLVARFVSRGGRAGFLFNAAAAPAAVTEIAARWGIEAAEGYIFIEGRYWFLRALGDAQATTDRPEP